MRVFSRGKDISNCPSGRSMCRCTDIMLFQNPPYMASRHLLIPRIAGAGTSFSPLPCQALHGNKVTNAHRVEVEVDADGLASAPLSGAAAAAPLAGAGRPMLMLVNISETWRKCNVFPFGHLRPDSYNHAGILGFKAAPCSTCSSINLSLGHTPRHTPFHHTNPQNPLQRRNPHTPRQNQSTQPLTRKRPRRCTS
jgi:hypothetical protein